jgi:hypothetical protein
MNATNHVETGGRQNPYTCPVICYSWQRGGHGSGLRGVDIEQGGAATVGSLLAGLAGLTAEATRLIFSWSIGGKGLRAGITEAMGSVIKIYNMRSKSEELCIKK